MIDWINDMIQSLPPLSQVDARTVMQDQYETRLGIYNHQLSKDRPLASVAMFPCENFTERSPLYDALEEYADGSFKEVWGLTVTEFLNLPQYQVRMIRDLTKEVLKRRTDIANAVKSDIENEAKRPGKRN